MSHQPSLSASSPATISTRNKPYDYSTNTSRRIRHDDNSPLDSSSLLDQYHISHDTIRQEIQLPPIDTTPQVQYQATSSGAPPLPLQTTRSGRHLHLLAPLTNRLHAQQPVPSIRIPANPYAGHTLQGGTLHRPTSSGSGPALLSPVLSHPLHPSTSSSQYFYPPHHHPSSGIPSPLPPSTSATPYTPGFIFNGVDYEERLLRSPHPPLTAALRPDYGHNSLWPPPLPSIGQSSSSHGYTRSTSSLSTGRRYFSSPIDNSQATIPGPSYPLSPSGLYYPSIPTQLAPPSNATFRPSPVIIPPPLRFNYSQSPPVDEGLYDPNMPPRRTKAVPAPGTNSHVTSTTPATVSSNSSSRRKTGPAVATRSSGGQGWTLEHTVDSIGGKKEVIVIDDSESPAHSMTTRKRTRAQIAAEAASATTANGVNGHTSGSASVGIKKRKVDEGSEAGSTKKPKTKASGTATSNYPSTHAAPAKQPAAPAGASSWDDADGHYIVKPDEFLGGKYRIVRQLGQGTFGKVVEARDIETRRKVAIKVIRAVQKYREASKIELRVLEALKKHDPHNLNKCIHMDEYFEYRSHPCIVSELYGMSVFDFLKQNGFSPFPPRHIQDFAKSLFKSVDFLHRLKLIHTDLKPENILLVSNSAVLNGPRVKGAKSRSILKSTDIRLIDFGSATFENEYHSSVVSTRHYRAPEIILGLPWSYPCDLFSIGCILVEFFTGDALFQTHDNLEHLAMMEMVMGKMPHRMIEKGRHKKPEFFKGHKIDFPNAGVSRSSRKFVKGLKALHEIIPPNNTYNRHFLDLITRLLDFDPDSRITVAQALQHPFCALDVAEPVYQ